jgi:hypothetical protein
MAPKLLLVVRGVNLPNMASAGVFLVQNPPNRCTKIEQARNAGQTAAFFIPPYDT